jgi:hypothetical protein
MFYPSDTTVELAGSELTLDLFRLADWLTSTAVYASHGGNVLNDGRSLGTTAVQLDATNSDVRTQSMQSQEQRPGRQSPRR